MTTAEVQGEQVSGAACFLSLPKGGAALTHDIKDVDSAPKWTPKKLTGHGFFGGLIRDGRLTWPGQKGKNLQNE